MYVVLFLAYLSGFANTYQVFAIGTYGVTMMDLVLVLFYAIIIKKLIWDGEPLRFRMNPAIMFLFVFIAGILLSGFTPLFESSAEQLMQYLKSTIHLFFLILLTLIAAFFPIKTKFWVNIIRLFLLLSVFINLFGIYQIFARAYDLPFAWLEATNVSLTNRGEFAIEEYSQLSLKYGNFFRATSIFTEPSALAGFNLYIFIYILIPYIKKSGHFFKSKLFTLFIFVLSLVTTFLTFSLTGFLGIMLVLSAVFFLDYTGKKIRILPFVAGSIILIFVADIVVTKNFNISVLELFSNRITGLIGSSDRSWVEGESFGGRLDNISEVLMVWEEDPILGKGTGLTQYSKASHIKYSDNGALAALAENGVLGFIGFVGMFASLFWMCFRMIKFRDLKDKFSPDEFSVTSVLFYVMILQFVVNFVSGNNVISAALWTIMAMMFSVAANVDYAMEKEFKHIYFVKKPLKETSSIFLKAYADKK